MEEISEVPVFEAEMKIIDGKKVPVIKCKPKTIVKADGTKDVVIEMPTLSVIKKFMDQNS